MQIRLELLILCPLLLAGFLLGVLNSVSKEKIMLKNKTGYKVLEEGQRILDEEEFNCLDDLLDDLNNVYNLNTDEE